MSLRDVPRLHRLAGSALVVACALGAGPALHADEGGHDHDRARQALEQGQVLPLRTVLDRVEREYDGQALKVEFEHEDGRFIYEIRLLQRDGRLVKLKVDARDGRIVERRTKPAR